MQRIIWTDDFALGNGTFNSEHRKLIDLINKTTECIENGGEPEEILSVLKALQDYAWLHFGAEEAYMTGIKFPGYDEHVHLHRNFINRVMDLQSRLFSGDDKVLSELSEFLNFWLIDHIVICDFKYASFSGTRKDRVVMI
jgi:hemerythrin